MGDIFSCIVTSQKYFAFCNKRNWKCHIWKMSYCNIIKKNSFVKVKEQFFVKNEKKFYQFKTISVFMKCEI